MKPAEAARAPAGPTKTTTGARAAIIRDTIARVDSSGPPGVRSTIIRQRRAACIGARDGAVDDLGGNRMDDPVVLDDDGGGWADGGRRSGGEQPGRERESGREYRCGGDERPHASLLTRGVVGLGVVGL